MDQLKIQPQALAEMIGLIEDTTISGKIAKDILPDLLEGKGNGGVKVRLMLSAASALMSFSSWAPCLALSQEPGLD